MADFSTRHLAGACAVIAPDGSTVRPLLELQGGSMGHFALEPGEVSTAVAHRTVEEIWFFVSGHGEMWRQQGDVTQTVEVRAAVCITIPVGTRFQFRASGNEPLAAIGVTMPPWPGDEEAFIVEGPWRPTVPR